MSCSSKWSLSFWLSHQYPICMTFLIVYKKQGCKVVVRKHLRLFCMGKASDKCLPIWTYYHFLLNRFWVSFEVYIKFSENSTSVLSHRLVVAALVTNFCHFGVPQELHSALDHNFESRLMQEVLQWLEVCKIHTTLPLHLQSDGMEERYVETVGELLWKVIMSHQRD
jgi:hypothetical protein